MTSKGAMLLTPGCLTMDQSPIPPTKQQISVNALENNDNSSSNNNKDRGVFNMPTTNEENAGTGNNHHGNMLNMTADPSSAISSTPTTTTTTTTSTVFATPSQKATASRASDPRLPTVTSTKSSSVFDRLYKSDTVSSRTHRISSRAMLSPKVRAGLRNNKVTNVDQELQLFSRLGVSDATPSANSRRSNRTPHKIKLSALGHTSFSTPPPKLSTYQLLHTAPHTAPSKTSVVASSSGTTRRVAARYEFSPRMKPVTKLYFISKFHPGVGLESVDPISLGYTFFQAFCEYESGSMDAPTIAKEILVAFFKKDFPAGRHWQLHEPIVGDKMVGKTAKEGTWYRVSMSATYDWEDAYRVAQAKGVVRFRRAQKEIRIENYRYDLTGDP
ncbi:hypothetical protein IV203_034000 [Nitzschia inconspicua]|uniref:Uncharacterized protein n=1 Tax=Nitzschia inconspicua TaxID=303405 RepID=A0A9K3M708_9STRA|nr:hypothetical protein IV203_034000 [Nitzschia inconspicua]